MPPPARENLTNGSAALLLTRRDASSYGAVALPTEDKVRGLAKKRLLRRAVEPLLPQQIIRGRKQGFSAPIAAWLRGELRPLLRDSLSREALVRQGFLEPAVVERLIETHVSGREDLSRQLWGLLSFTLWYERFAAAPVVGE